MSKAKPAGKAKATGKIIDLMAALKESLARSSPTAPDTASAPPAEAQLTESPAPRSPSDTDTPT